MFKIAIKIYGLPKNISSVNEVEVVLAEGGGMPELIAALKEKLPELEGPVIRKGENRLVDHFKFNINGQFYYDGMDFKLQKEDKIGLLIPVTGG